MMSIIQIKYRQINNYIYFCLIKMINILIIILIMMNEL